MSGGGESDETFDEGFGVNATVVEGEVEEADDDEMTPTSTLFRSPTVSWEIASD